MAKIYNSDLSKELVEGAKIQTSFDYTPDQLAEKVVPVMEVNPKLLKINNFIKNNFQTTTGTIAIITTPADKDTYITGLSAGYVKDVTCDSATGVYSLTCVINGATHNLIQFPIITLTAQQDEREITFAYPVKVDRASAIQLTGTFTAGVCVRTCTLYGYQDFNVNA